MVCLLSYNPSLFIPCLSILAPIHISPSFIYHNLFSGLNHSTDFAINLPIFMSLCLKLNSYLNVIYSPYPYLFPQILKGTNTRVHFFSINRLLKLLLALAHKLKILDSPRTT